MKLKTVHFLSTLVRKGEGGGAGYSHAHDFIKSRITYQAFSGFNILVFLFALTKHAGKLPAL